MKFSSFNTKLFLGTAAAAAAITCVSGETCKTRGQACKYSRQCCDHDIFYCQACSGKCCRYGDDTTCHNGDGVCSESCMAGGTGFTKVKKMLGEVVSSNVIKLQDLEVGDRIKGLNQVMAVSDECEVASVSTKGNGTLYGNYTSDHYILNSGETDLIMHGSEGEVSTEPIFQVLTSCPLTSDETGKQTTFSICGKILYGGVPMPWSIYLKIHATMFKLVKSSGIRDISALRDIEYANEHLPGLCKSALKCTGDDNVDCKEFEEKMLTFVSHELTADARKKALAAFPNLGDATKMGSVSYLVSKGKSAVASLE